MRAQAPEALPLVHLVYPAPNGTIFDISCGALVKTVINPDAVKETVRRLPEFQARWDREGPAYLSLTYAEVGLPFPYKEMQAALTVCPGVPSLSAPLMISVRRDLSTSERRDPEWVLALGIYHELMHTYTRPVHGVSVLRKKYAAEQPRVLNHLHVMALETLVLLKRGKTDELAWLGRDYETTYPPAYRRAWQIVSSEGHQAFISELRQLARGSR